VLAETIQVHVSSDAVLDWITGALALVTAGMAVATFRLGKVAKKEAEATIALADGALRDRELAVQPVLTYLDGHIQKVTPEGGPIPVVFLRNIGRGPAIRTRVFQWSAGEWFWNGGVGVPTIGVDEACPPQVNLDGHKYMPLTSRRGAEAVHNIPGSGKATEDLWAYCLDWVSVQGRGVRGA
jgi:hypothetical protein